MGGPKLSKGAVHDFLTHFVKTESVLFEAQSEVTSASEDPNTKVCSLRDGEEALSLTQNLLNKEARLQAAEALSKEGKIRFLVFVLRLLDPTVHTHTKQSYICSLVS